MKCPPRPLLENENNDELNDWPRSGDSDIPPVTHARDLRSAPVAPLIPYVSICMLDSLWISVLRFKKLKSVFSNQASISQQVVKIKFRKNKKKYKKNEVWQKTKKILFSEWA